MSATIDPAQLRHGRVRGRYFRENFAQAGIDLAQIVPELATNADAAIAAVGHRRGRIELRFASPDPEFARRWRRELKALRMPALLEWAHEIVCVDDGEGVDADTVERRLGALGVAPEQGGQRGLFGRGLRDVWLAPMRKTAPWTWAWGWLPSAAVPAHTVTKSLPTVVRTVNPMIPNALPVAQ